MYKKLNDPLNFSFGYPMVLNWNDWTFGLNQQGNIVPTGGGFYSTGQILEPGDFSHIAPTPAPGVVSNPPVNNPDKIEFTNYFASFPGRLVALKLAFEKMNKLFIEMTFYRSTMTAYFLQKEKLTPGTTSYNVRGNELRQMKYQDLLELRLKDYKIDLFGNAISEENILGAIDTQTLLMLGAGALFLFKMLKK